MKKYLISLLIISLLLSGCGPSLNQLKGEQSYYTARVALSKQATSIVLFEMTASDNTKPIILQNVATFKVFAPPAGNNENLAQYTHRDYVQPWLNLMGMAVPWFGAWGIVKAVADIPRVNSNSTVNQNSGNTATTTSTFTNTASGGSVANMGSGSATLNNISTIEAPVVVTGP